MRRSHRMVLVSSFLSALACGGASLGEDRPGDDGILDHVDPPSTEPPELQGDGRCTWTGDLEVGVGVERAYVLVYEADVDCAALGTTWDARKTVWGWAPGDAVARPLVDVTGYDDVRITFTADGLLLMGQRPAADATTTWTETDRERLWLVDETTLAVRAARDSDTWYWGTRTSPTRRWVAVADNAADDHPIHVLDPATLEATSIATDAVWLEAMWANHTDLLTSVIRTPSETVLRTWSFAGRDGLPSIGGRVAMPPVLGEIPLPGLVPNPLFSYSWLAVAPDDHAVALPMTTEAGAAVLAVVDLGTGDVTEVPDVYGPVAWTPDGSSLVGYAADDDGAALVVVDPVTREVERIEVEAGLPTFFVSRDGADVVVTDTFDPRAPLTVVDLETGEATVLHLRGPLTDFVYRDGHEDLFSLARGHLRRVDLALAEGRRIPLPFVARALNWLPEADLLVVSDAERPALSMVDPDTGAVRATTPLGDARRSRAPLSLARR